MSAQNLTLDSKAVGPLPIIDALLRRLDLQNILSQTIGAIDHSPIIPHVTSILALLKNLIISREPLYALTDWALRFESELVGIDPSLVHALNDDRIARALDRLFESDRASLQTRIVTSMIKAFDIELSQFHNDSTSITFDGDYLPDSKGAAANRPRITHGHNKEHRPDLKQLLWSLTISADGAIPVICQVLDGNRSDDTTHIETWNILRALVGKADFIYVADCKLASKENLAHIHNNGGFFVTVMPRNRGENLLFKKRLQQDGLVWKALELPGRSDNSEEKTLFEGVEAEAKSSDGYRILWIRSSQKQKLDVASRQAAIQKALAQIKSLAPRVGTRNLKTRDQIQARIDKILLQSDAAKWVEAEILEKQTTSHKHPGRGRPAKDAVPLELVHTEYTVVARPLESAIEADKRADGLFPLITNVLDKSIQEVLSIYKYQPKLEKRHQQLKSVLTVAPMHLKTVERIESLLFLEFIALLVHALLEREVRRAMERHGCASLPLYHERRPSEHPTAAQILGAFEQLRVHRLRDNGLEMQVFRDALNPIQRTLLNLLGLSPSIFGQN